MDAVSELRKLLREEIARKVPVQTLWAEVSSVDMEEGTMDCTAEGLEVFDVLIGLGGDKVEPAVGSRVLLGLVGNMPEACFLLYAEQVNRRFINGDMFGGLVKADEVAAELVKVQNDINQLKQFISTWIPVPNDGGASLKVQVAPWSGQQLSNTPSETLQNTTVSHG